MQPDYHNETTFLDPATFRLECNQDDSPSLTIDETTYTNIRIRCAFPMSDERRYIAFFDEFDDYIGMVIDPADLDPLSRKIVDEELRWRYFTPQITRIHRMQTETGRSSLDVETDRGGVTITFRGMREHITEISPNRVMITDEHENRYEIRDINRLDRKSRRLIQRVV